MRLFILAMLTVITIGHCEEIGGRPDIRPLDNKDIVRIAGIYGDKRSAEGKTYFHTGIDYACNLDTPIYATGSGEVIFARFCGGYGNCVIIKHSWIDDKGNPQSCYSLYAHIVEFTVKKGDKVSKRQVIGLAGMTGRSEGVHLHYELRDANNHNIWNGLYQAMNKRGE